MISIVRRRLAAISGDRVLFSISKDQDKYILEN